MQILNDALSAQTLHHAYCIVGGRHAHEELVRQIATRFPDAERHERAYDTLGIDESRALAQLAHLRSQGVQVFLVRAETLTREAQNALLKLFEEPPRATHFFLSMSESASLLPTLRSRMWEVVLHESERDAEGSVDVNIDAAAFLRATHHERLTLLEPVIQAKDKAQAALWLNALEAYLATHARTDARTRSALSHILAVRRVLNQQGASVKILLESVALTTPAHR